MEFVLEGILMGLGLSILLGPIFIVLIQASIERGARAGLMAASGIWISDVIIVYFALNFMRHISPFIESKGFVFWIGLVGGLVLIGVGMTTFVKKGLIRFADKSLGAQGYFRLWLQGFLVNTINPFTIIFWISLISTRILTRLLSDSEATIYLSSVIGTIIVTDSLKVFMAKWIRNRITETLLTTINKIAGIALILFGLLMLGKSAL